MELLPEGEDVFFAVASDARIRFVRNAEGQVIEAVVESGGRTTRAVRQ
jgi:hypothetical protein